MTAPSHNELGEAPQSATLHPELMRCLRGAGIHPAGGPPDAEQWRELLPLLSRAMADLQAGVSVAMPQRPSDPAGAPVLDMAVVESLRSMRAPGAPDPVIELCTLFVDDMASRVVRIQGALARRDAKEIADQAHAMKGAAGNFGAWRVYTAAKRLESSAAGAHADELVSELAAELEVLRQVMERDVLQC